MVVDCAEGKMWGAEPARAARTARQGSAVMHLMGCAQNNREAPRSEGVWPCVVEASVVLATFNDKPAVALTRHH